LRRSRDHGAPGKGGGDLAAVFSNRVEDEFGDQPQGGEEGEGGERCEHRHCPFSFTLNPPVDKSFQNGPFQQAMGSMFSLCSAFVKRIRSIYVLFCVRAAYALENAGLFV
jgi:hypothetical protein